MRDLVLLSILGFLVIRGLRHPWIGMMGWTWVSIMNPHALSYSSRNLPVAMAMALTVFVGMLLTRDRREVYVTRESAALIAFMVWMCITLPFSINVDISIPMWTRVMKIDLMILVALIVLHSRQHIRVLTWVVVGSIGFFGFKGGFFTIATGGSYRVWGPENSYIEGNNEVALAFIVVIPLMRFLQVTSDNNWTKRFLALAMLLNAAAALGSHSRGALLAIAAMGFMMWLRGEKKFQSAIVIGVLGTALVAFMPDNWTDRMGTIKTYDADESALGRINAWWMAWNLAKDRFFGGGYQIYDVATFAKYAPDPNDLHAAHSIYFMVLGEHGFVGLFLFLLIWALVWQSAARLRKDGLLRPETVWAFHLGGMCQVALAGYLVGGAFLSLSYFDLPYNILILVVVAKRWVAREAWREEAEHATVPDSVAGVPKPGGR